MAMPILKRLGRKGQVDMLNATANAYLKKNVAEDKEKNERLFNVDNANFYNCLTRNIWM